MPDTLLQYAGIPPLANYLAPGAKIAAYVDSSSPSTGDFAAIESRLYTTLNAGLAQCRSGAGDVVVVMPGHAETISTADQMSSLVAGTVILGGATGTLRPTFTWSAAAATFLLDVANVRVENCIFKMAGDGGGTALTVAQAMTISAAGCQLVNCDFQCEVDANEGATLGVVTTAAADDLTIHGCKFYGSSNGTLPTTYLRFVGADRLRMTDCTFHGATSSNTVGVVQFLTTASTNVHIENCSFTNLKTGASHAATGMAGITGTLRDCTFDPECPLPTPKDLGLTAGAKVASYVDASSTVNNINLNLLNHRFDTTLNAGLAECRASSGDAVVVMPGHAENVASADQMAALVAGVRVIGMGRGTLRPTFTWTTATSTWLLDAANCTIENCILLMAADNSGATIAAPITVSAAGCMIKDCRIEFGFDADDIVTIGITTTAAGDDFTLDGCFCTSPVAAECTTFLRAVGADRLTIRNTVIDGATSSTTVGVVQFLTTASTFCKLENSTFINRKALSVHAVTGLASCSGVVRDCDFGILDTATLAGLVTPADFMGFRNKTVNTTGEQGGETSTVSA